jgi:type I restriction enzyme R subunit
LSTAGRRGSPWPINQIERKSLVVMATGTRKARTVVALTKLLQEANWAKRV